MKKKTSLAGIVAVLLCGSAQVLAQEVPFTLEDRDRLIRMEATLNEFKDSVAQRFENVEARIDGVDKRIDGVDKRIEGFDRRIEGFDRRFERLETVMMGGFGLLFTSMIGLVGFVLWDRRSALAPAIRKSNELENESERIKRALREMAQKDSNVAEALKHVGLL